jgi:hypothetical protein
MNEFTDLVRKLNGIQNNKKELPILSSDSNEIPNGKKVIMETANILKELDRISTEKRMVANPRLEEDYTNEDLLGDLQSRYANFLNPIAVTEDDEEEDKGEVKVDDYQTRHFDMCPGATSLYKDIEGKGIDMGLAERTAKMQDVLFYLEKDPDRKHVEEDAVMAQVVADQIMDMAGMMGLTNEHQYIQGHVDTIKERIDK